MVLIVNDWFWIFFKRKKHEKLVVLQVKKLINKYEVLSLVKSRADNQSRKYFFIKLFKL